MPKKKPTASPLKEGFEGWVTDPPLEMCLRNMGAQKWHWAVYLLDTDSRRNYVLEEGFTRSYLAAFYAVQEAWERRSETFWQRPDGTRLDKSAVRKKEEEAQREYYARWREFIYEAEQEQRFEHFVFESFQEWFKRRQEEATTLTTPQS